MCQVVWSCNLSFGPVNMPLTKIVLATLVLTTFASILTIGSLGAVQDSCYPDDAEFKTALAGECLIFGANRKWVVSRPAVPKVAPGCLLRPDLALYYVLVRCSMHACW